MTTELVELAEKWLAQADEYDAEAIDAISDFYYAQKTTRAQTCRDHAHELRALASRAGGSDGWVSVTDRLPEPYQDVEVYPSWDDDTSNTYCPHDGGTNGRKAGNWYHNDREGYDHKINVTHWRPRAKPPAAPEPVAVGS